MNHLSIGSSYSRALNAEQWSYRLSPWTARRLTCAEADKAAIESLRLRRNSYLVALQLSFERYAATHITSGLSHPNSRPFSRALRAVDSGTASREIRISQQLSPDLERAVVDRDTVVAASASDFQSLLGVREVQDFEAKQEWPDFATARSRWEFAKDVAAMANGGGGIIVYGLATQKLLAEQADETVAVHPINPAAFNSGMAIGILTDHISPRLRDVRIDLIPGLTLAPTGAVVVDVPRQNGKVLLCKAMEGEEGLKEYLFGFAERDRDGTRNWTREEVSRMIRSGTDAISARLEAIENILSSMNAERRPVNEFAPDDDAVLNARLDEVARDE